nr:MAG TPA: hypothetical protein [Bacteriophage sp.]
MRETILKKGYSHAQECFYCFRNWNRICDAQPWLVFWF